MVQYFCEVCHCEFATRTIMLHHLHKHHPQYDIERMHCMYIADPLKSKRRPCSVIVKNKINNLL